MAVLRCCDPNETGKEVDLGPSQSLFECAISRIYADSAVSALSLEQALAHKSGCPPLARSLWAGFRQPRRQRVFGQATGIPHSNRLSASAQTFPGGPSQPSRPNQP